MIITIDTVLLRIADRELQVLLWRRPQHSACFAGQWALPGAPVIASDPDLEAASRRILHENVDLEPDYLEQVATVGSANRNPDGWSISVLNLALIRYSVSGHHQANTQWVSVQAIRNRTITLPFDHAELLEQVLERLNAKARYSTLPLYLAEHQLKLPELQHIYEIVLGNPLHKRAFRERILGANVLEDTGVRIQGRGSPATIYRYQTGCPVRLFDRVMEGKTQD
jgi:8-oxo-dGTP diphosphatase